MAVSNPAVTSFPHHQSHGYSHPRPNQSGHIQQLKLPSADNPTPEQILRHGHVFYFAHSGKIFTSYGLCSIMLNNQKHIYYICKFDKPNEIVTLDKSDKNYFFYSEPIPENKKLIKPDLYSIEQLLHRDWKSHSNTPFESISAFFHELISLSVNPTVLKKIIQSKHKLDWGYVDYNGNTYLHKACIHPESDIFITELIQSMNTYNSNLINQLNKDRFTPLALLSKFSLKDSSYDAKKTTFDYIFNGGAHILIHNETDTMQRLIMEDFAIVGVKEINSSETHLAISFAIYKSLVYTSYSIYALLTKPNEPKVIETKKLTECLPEVLVIQKNFADILSLNCPQILDYIFDPNKKLVSKTTKFPGQNGSSLLHIAAGICESELLFKHMVSNVTDWRLENPTDENILHTCISNGKYRNLNVLINTIPLNELNILLFAKNQQNMAPLKAIVEFAENEQSIKLIIAKGCLDENGNNLAHCAILYKNMNFLRLVIRLSSAKSIFMHENKNGLNALHLAVKQSFEEAVMLLVDNSDLTILSSRDNTGCNCLHTSIIHFILVTFKAILGAIIKYDKIGTDNNRILNSKIIMLNSQTPFLLSIEKQKLEATEILLSHGARIDIPDCNSQYFPYYIQNYCRDELKKLLALKVDQRNYPLLKNVFTIEDLSFNGSPLLFYFFQFTSFELFQSFCAAFSLRNIIKPNKEGSTILHLASNNDKMTKFILRLCSDFIEKGQKTEITNFINAINNKDETALSIAVRECKLDIVELIIAIGGSIEIEYPYGNNILHIAISTKKTEIVEIFLRHPKIGQFLCKPNDSTEIPIISLLKSDGTGTINAITNVVDKDFQGLNGESMLHLVVQNGNEETLKEIFKLISFSNLIDKNRQTPLHYAVIYSKLYAIKLLAQHGYDISTPDAYGKTPIHYAIDGKSVDVWNAIFEILQNMNNLETILDKKGLTLLQYSIEMNNLPATKDIFTFKPTLFPYNSDKYSLIHLAASSPEKAYILSFLLENIPKDQLDIMLLSYNKEQLHPLHWAIYNQNIEGVKILRKQDLPLYVKIKGEISFFSRKLEKQFILCKRNAPKLTYLFGYTMKYGSQTKLILTDIPAFTSTQIFGGNDIVKFSGQIPQNDLSIFLESSCIDLISYIIAHKHVSLAPKYPNGATLLHYAAKFGNLVIINYLIKVHKLSIVELDNQKNSILYYALQNSESIVVDELFPLIIEQTKKDSTLINLFEISNIEGKRILDLCLQFRNIHGFISLLPHIPDLLYSDSKGFTLLHHICQSDNGEDFIRQLIDELKRRKETDLSEYINRTTADKHKLAPLHLAVIKGNNFIVNLLIKNSADPLIVTANKQSVLHYAVSRKIPEEIITTLLNYPRLLEMADAIEQTPLFYSITSNNVNALNILIKHHIDFHHTDKEDKTIMNYSIENNNIEIWNIIFPKFRMSISKDFTDATITLCVMIQVCIKSNNERAFSDLLELQQCATFAEPEWRPLIECSIIEKVNTFFLSKIFAYLKAKDWIELYFYPKSLNFTPPLLIAIKHQNIKAIELMLAEKISLSFTNSDNRLTLFSQSDPASLTICTRRTRSLTLLIGYKIDKTNYLLVNLPKLDNTNLYKSTEVTELQTLSINHLIEVLRSPCIEPINSIINSSSRNKLTRFIGCGFIHFATQHGSIEVLQHLLTIGLNIIELDGNSNSILYYALVNNIPEIFQIICDHLADKLKIFDLFNCQNTVGNRILDICIERNDFKSFCLLLNAKYNVMLDYVDSRGYTLFHKLILLKKDVEFFVKLHSTFKASSKYKSLIGSPAQSSNLTPLHLAISENLHEYVDFMLKEKYDLCVVSKCGNFPLHLAVINNFEKQRLDLIIDAIPKDRVTSVVNTKNIDCYTPLHLATLNGNNEIVESLLKHSPNITCEDNEGNTPLHLASRLNYFLIVKILIEYVSSIQGDYPSFINSVNMGKMTSLHLAIIHSNLEIAVELLAGKAGLYATDHSGRTVLHHAVEISDENTSINTIKFLIDHEERNPDPERKLILIQDNSYNDTPLHIAIKGSMENETKQLLAGSPDLTQCDREKMSVLHHAISQNHPEIIDNVLEYIKNTYSMETMDPVHVLNLQDKDGNTALNLAIIDSREDSLAKLLAINPLLNLKNKSGQTPLHIAVSKKESILKMILDKINENPQEKNSYLYAVDNEGLPPLHYAIVRNHLKSVETLIEFGALLSNTESLTLFNGKSELSLCFCKAKEGLLRKFVSIFLGNNLLVGYQMKNKAKWVITTLPELTVTKVVGNQDVVEFTQTIPDANVVSIVKCASTEPIEVAIEKNLVDHKRKENNGNWLKNLATKQEGHINVSTFLLSTNTSIKELCEAIKHGVKSKEFENLLDKLIPTKHNYQIISEPSNDSNQEEIFIHNISITLCEMMELSLENPTNDALKKILSFNPCLNYKYGDKKDSTLLHLIVEKSISLDFMKEYLEKVKTTEDQNSNGGKRIIDFQNSSSMTALNLCIEKEQKDDMQTILSFEPKLSLCDAFKNSSLHFAAKSGNLMIAKVIIDYILKYPDLKYLFNDKNSDGCIPLHKAIESGNVEVCELLLEKDSEFFSKDNAQKSILHHAILILDTCTRDSMVEFILRHPMNCENAIVELKDDKGKIPLHNAVIHKCIGVVQMLAQFAKSIKDKDNNGQTALHLSCIYHCEGINDILVDKMIEYENNDLLSLEDRVINYCDVNKKTPLHLSIEHQNKHAVTKLLTAHPNLEMVDALKNTYLHTAVETDKDPFYLTTILSEISEESLTILFSRLNNWELPPLQFAILKKNFQAVDILVKKGAKLDYQNQGRICLCPDNVELKLRIVEYKSHCWTGFRIWGDKKEYYVIANLPSLDNTSYIPDKEASKVKEISNLSNKIDVIRLISECESSDPLNTAIQDNLISADSKLPEVAIEIAKHGTKDVINRFYNFNKDTLFYQKSGESMIESAVKNRNLDSLELLLSYLPEFQQHDVSSTNPTDSKDIQISLCIKNSLQISLDNSKPGALIALLKHTKINYLYSDGKTLLHLAIEKGISVNFLESIFNKVKEDGFKSRFDEVSFVNKQSNGKKQTALHICIEKMQAENLKEMLRNSADPFLCDSDKNTALHYSVCTNQLDFVQTIYNSTDEKQRLLAQINTENHSALHLAVIQENPKIVEFLLKLNAPFYPVNDGEHTLLHLAIRIKNESAQTEIMNQLFQHDDSTHESYPITRLKDCEGFPPLHLAAALRTCNALQLLLNVDPSVLYIQDARGYTPLHISLIHDIKLSEVKVMNNSFCMNTFKIVLYTIVPTLREQDPHIIVPILDPITSVPPKYKDIPCCTSCDVNKVICTQDNRDRTAMHYAIQHGHVDAFGLILATNSCLDIPDEKGNILLHEAGLYGTNIECMKLLIQALHTRTDGHFLDCFNLEQLEQL